MMECNYSFEITGPIFFASTLTLNLRFTPVFNIDKGKVKVKEGGEYGSRSSLIYHNNVMRKLFNI